ncbi:MAG: membrane protein insertase YidC [Crocinitomicaceae bacterium]|nr:membrane protein insertase YidC [Crocinitomicaceae bacterium]|tara:strand:- start:9113 stop:11044 length:1932 start_codon:yes stop_codon:yes gene_type:complete
MAKQMDRNSLVGFVLIGAILIGYTYWMAPNEAEIAAHERKMDSIAQVEKQEVAAKIERDSVEMASTKNQTEILLNDSMRNQQDSLRKLETYEQYGRFSDATSGAIQYYTIENEKIRVKISTKGGRPVSAELKEYKKFDETPLYLFDEDSSEFSLSFKSQNRVLNTSNFFFKATGTDVSVTGDSDQGSLSMRLYAGSSNKYIEYVYSIKGNSYDLDFKINYVGIDDILMDNANKMALNWQIKTPAHEKGFQTENMRTSIFYKPVGDDRDYISERSAERLELDDELESNLEWIAFKQQFFTVAMKTEQPFVRNGGYLETVQMPEQGSNYIKDMIVNVKLPVDPGSKSSSFKIFLGPNQFYTLKDYDLESILDLGWGIFGWVSKWFIIPIFFGLSMLDISYGIIILLLTLLIKLILSPLTYKSYLSGAKMRVLKPEIEELNKKNKNADAMKKQQDTMALYKKAGVNPMAGCIPMLLQMPILYAMFMFFPSSIELRGESFLWASDLAAYDSIFDLPFSIPFYGSHVSLFTLLMAFSMFFYTKSNMASGTMGGGGEMQAQQMKIMLYFMPVMMLFFFNSYPAGLSYYYLCANLTSIGQNWFFRKYLVNDDEIHAKVQENKKKPAKKKSKFQKRLEEMAKQRGMDVPKK